uniref:Uncharacterized protein n=1 Tax=Tetranychus urticae TaxID=32264 RepID=T1K1S7_TETUR
MRKAIPSTIEIIEFVLRNPWPRFLTTSNVTEPFQALARLTDPSRKKSYSPITKYRGISANNSFGSQSNQFDPCRNQVRILSLLKSGWE